MKIVKSKNPLMKNRVVILPVVGKITFNEKCEFEVKNDIDAEELVSIESLDLELVESFRKETKAEEKVRLALELENTMEVGSKDVDIEEEEDDKVITLSTQDKTDFINSVINMDELKELASGFPIKEWEKIKSKAKLKDYLISKI